MSDRNLHRAMSYSVRDSGNGKDNPFDYPMSPAIGRTTQGPNSSTYKGSVMDAKASFGSESSRMSYEYFNVDDGTYGQDSDLLKSLSDDSSFKKDEETEKLLKDPIFERLCAREGYKDFKECKVCSKGFNLLNGRKHWQELLNENDSKSKFCGESVCDEHGKKRRPDPQNPSDHVRICDVCENKFINRIILREFTARLREKEKESQEWERKIKTQQMNMKDVQGDYDKLINEKSKVDKGSAMDINSLLMEIARIKDDTKKCEKENALLTKEHSETHGKVEELENEYNKMKEEYEKLRSEAKELNLRIDAINADIFQTNKELSNLDEMITRSKMNKFNESTPNTFYAGDSMLLANESIVEPGDSILETVDEKKRKTTMANMKSVKNPTQSGKNTPNKSKDPTKSDKGGVCNINCGIF